MRILLFGANGQVGHELRRSLALLGEVVATTRSGAFEDGTTCERADFDAPAALPALIERIAPDIVVNAAAYTAVDKAESDRDAAFRANAEAPAFIAEACAARGTLMVHYSTDYVFDGSGETPWREDDATGPLSVYGATKLEGEQLVAAHCARHLIFRTSWVYAARGGNFAKTMLRLAKERERLTVIDDQWGAPTGAELLADVTALAIRETLRDPAKAGLYHLVAGGTTNWNGYARFVVEEALRRGVELKTTPDAVEAVPTSAFPTPARRPHNSRLDTSRIRSTFGIELPHWQAGVARMLAETL